jgi:hypothetical protein
MVVVTYSPCVSQEKFNPGIRLHRLMAWAYEYGHGQQAGAPPTQAWAEHFGLTWPSDFGDLLRAGSDVVQLTAEVRGMVESLDGKENVDMLLRRFGEVEKVMENWPQVAAVANMQNVHCAAVRRRPCVTRVHRRHAGSLYLRTRDQRGHSRGSPLDHG